MTDPNQPQPGPDDETPAVDEGRQDPNIDGDTERADQDQPTTGRDADEQSF